jgi:hypothetical protein
VRAQLRGASVALGAPCGLPQPLPRGPWPISDPPAAKPDSNNNSNREMSLIHNNDPAFVLKTRFLSTRHGAAADTH